MTELQAALAEFLASKKFDLRKNTFQQLEFRISKFVKHCTKADARVPADLTREMFFSYRETWQRYSDLTQKQHASAIKAFLKDCGREDLARKLKLPRPTAEGNERRKPRPFSDDEIKAFLSVASPRVGLFFRTQIATGLAVSDMVRLRLENLQDGCVVISRQKTGKPVRVRISPGLYHELEVGLPFHSGSRVTGVGKWSDLIRNSMCRAGIYSRWGLTHRCRDSFVDRQLSNGTSLAVIAAALGDLISTVEKHYQSLDSMRMRQQIQQAPVIEIPVTI
jgi:integrase